MQNSVLVHSPAVVDARPRPVATNLVLLLSDAFGLAASFAGAVIVSLVIQSAESPAVLFRFTPMLAIVPMLFVLLGLYPAAGMSPIDEMRVVVITVTAPYAVLASFISLTFLPGFDVYVVLICAWLFSVGTLATGRVVWRQLFSQRPWWGIPVVVLGAGKSAELVMSRLAKNPVLGLKVVGCLDDDSRKIGTSVAGVPVLGPLDQASRIKQEFSANYAIVAMPGLEPRRLSGLVQWLGTTFANVVVIPNAFGMTSVGVGTRDSGGVVGLHVRGHLSLRSNRVAKRVTDIVLLIPLGAIAIPIIALSAIAVFIVSPGNPFYSQEREGYLGRRIRIWKLRTMRLDSDKVLDRHLESHPGARHEWETHFKLVNDPRILPGVGSLLRRMSLDELPQVLNVARGDMSFVGPRPFPFYHLEQFEPGFRDLRRSVVPGLTGYWQVTSRSTADLVAQVELDSYYITNWSLWFDAYIIARTPWAILFGNGAH